ncbi:MAG TPA: GtrA family protein [Polyangiaceae bacterium]
MFSSTLLRHQVASLVATSVDFSLMILLVEVAKVAPSTAALAGAGTGAIVNFAYNRRHTFPRAREGTQVRQAVRYAVVSAASAALNAAGEHVGTRLLGLPYVLTRMAVSLIVGLCWNYPLHRGFVFASPAAGKAP